MEAGEQSEWKVVAAQVCVKAAISKKFLKKDEIVQVGAVDTDNRTLSITKPYVGTVVYQLENGTDLLTPCIETAWIVIKPVGVKRALGRKLLEKDAEVRVVEIDSKKKRVQIDSPCKGWATYETKSGDTLIMPKSKLERIRRKRKQSVELNKLEEMKADLTAKTDASASKKFASGETSVSDVTGQILKLPADELAKVSGSAKAAEKCLDQALAQVKAASSEQTSG